MIPRHLRLLIAAACAGAVSAAPPASAQTFVEALSAAYLNNPTLLAARARLRAVDEEVPQALSNWRPSVEMDAAYGESEVTSNIATNRRQFREPRSIGVSITQPLYRGGRTQAQVREAELTVLAERRRLTSVEQDVLLDVAAAYVNVVRDQTLVDLNVNNRERLRRQLEATRDRFRVGEVTRTDVSQAESRLARAEADLVQAVGALETARAAFRSVVGEWPQTLQPIPPVAGLPDSQLQAVQIAIREAPDVQAAEFDAESQQATIDLTRGELLPTVSLQGSANRNFDSVGEESRVDELEAQVVLSVPIYQQGAVYSRVRQAQQTLGQRLALADAERRQAAEEAATAWEELRTARAAIQSFQAEVAAAEIALEGVEREAEVGARTVLDVLDAQQELLTARASLVRAQRDERVASFELRAALGRMTARDLDLPVEYYDPALHYTRVRDRWFGLEP